MNNIPRESQRTRKNMQLIHFPSQNYSRSTVTSRGRNTIFLLSRSPYLSRLCQICILITNFFLQYLNINRKYENIPPKFVYVMESKDIRKKSCLPNCSVQKKLNENFCKYTLSESKVKGNKYRPWQTPKSANINI